MSFEILSPNMNLPVPSVGETGGPQYATDEVACFNIVDAHDHTSGSGVQITPSGLNINVDFPMNTNNITMVKSLRFTAQGSPLAGGSDLGCLYESGVDLYYNDGSGNQVRITQSGGVAGSPGSIGSLSSPASATYVAATPAFVFQSAANTPANIDGGSHVFRNLTASSNGITLSAPNALGSNYTITLPALPAQTNVMTINTSGNLGSITYDAVGAAMTSTGANAIVASVTAWTPTSTVADSVGSAMGTTGSQAIAVTMASTGANSIINNYTRTTGTTVGLRGVAISGISGAFTITGGGSTTDTPITNLSVTLTTSGRPIRVGLMNADDVLGTGGYCVTGGTATISLFRSTTVISENGFQGTVPAGGFNTIDTSGAGTYNFLAKIRQASTSDTSLVNQVRLYAYEL